ncbi:pyruvate kinase [Candidatus Woesebacteria bacterium]|nr:pyruvate kinase [Candidatus Woesebacteria bacterium]
MSKSTKIVATIGPATETEEKIEQLITAGMNVARFNTKHGTADWHQERIQRVRSVAERLHQPISILLDLQGPEIRITIPGGQPFEVKEGEAVVFTAHENATDPRTPMIPAIVVQALQEGKIILIDDGLGEFIVTKNLGTELHAVAQSAFTVGNRKTLNTPGVVIDLPSLIPPDILLIDAVGADVEYVGLSFVRDARDIHILRSELDKRNSSASIVAKIENQSALDHLDEIIETSDAVMVARGDLAVEVPYQELAYWQKLIIHKSRESGKPVITATQMLKSMVEKPRPTRAEVSDVANAVYDGTDAVMLSEETTIGKYPVEAVSTQRTIVEFNEPHALSKPLSTTDSNPASYITHSAVSLLEISQFKTNNLKIDKLVCLTETGETARLISRFRPHIPVFALTSNTNTYHKMSLLFGVTPFIVELPANDRLESSGQLLEKLRELKIATPGETILLVHGTFWKKPGLTNTLSILQIE